MADRRPEVPRLHSVHGQTLAVDQLGIFDCVGAEHARANVVFVCGWGHLSPINKTLSLLSLPAVSAEFCCSNQLRLMRCALPCVSARPAVRRLQSATDVLETEKAHLIKCLQLTLLPQDP